LNGPLIDIVDDKRKIDALLQQATKLGDLLSYSFNTPTGIPKNSLFVFPDGPQLSDEETNGLATTGTLILEWTRLSDLTGDPKYRQLAQRAEDYLLRPLNPEVGEPWPGLLGTDVNVTDGLFINSSGGWNGGTDSFYEYLIKMYLYDSDAYGEYLERWVAAIDSSIKYLTSHPTSRPDLTFLAAYEGRDELLFVSSHCE
jgi:mannosyl-oligosaccharide alpha-1,2-mannosidase